jgi:hypothetical protein
MVSAEDLADGIGKVGNAAKQTNTSMEQLNSMTAAIVSSTGISGLISWLGNTVMYFRNLTKSVNILSI